LVTYVTDSTSPELLMQLTLFALKGKLRCVFQFVE